MKKISVIIAVVFLGVLLFIIKEEPDDSFSFSFSPFKKKTEPRPEFKGRRPEAEPAIRLKNTSREPNHEFDKEQTRILTEGYGTFPKIDVSNPKFLTSQQRFVIKALRDPVNNSGAISIIGKRAKYDSKKYKSSRKYSKAYLESAEPGRAFDAANSGPKVKPLERIGNSSIQTTQNVMVKLQVKGDPGQPCSVTAFDGGVFQSGLGYMTSKFDGSGVCTFEFTPTDGVINQCRIRAASPAHSGTLQWTVWAHLPKEKSTQKK